MKTWLAIPLLAIACAGLAFASRQPIENAIALGALAAALAAAVRAFAGPSIAVAVAGGAASLVGVLALLDLPLPDVARATLACAAGMFAVAELARPLPPGASPWPALGAASLAALLDPSFALLLPVTGVRFVTGPWSVRRWMYAVPVAGTLVAALAACTAVFHGGALAELWATWAARDAVVRPPLETLGALGELLGPVTSVVAIAGVGVCAARGRIAASAALGVLAGGLGIDLVAGAPGAATAVAAALGAGAGISRFAALVRWPTGQAFVGAVVGTMLVVAPAWTLAMR